LAAEHLNAAVHALQSNAARIVARDSGRETNTVVTHSQMKPVCLPFQHYPDQ